MNSRLSAALAYLKDGFSILPVEPNGKKPLIQWEPLQTKLPTTEMLNLWWQQWPNANVGVITGELSYLSVVDIDGERGKASIREYGLTFPLTRTVKTPRGWHLWYLFVPTLHTGAGFVPGLDIRGQGGYVVAPPSSIDAHTYTVIRDLPIMELDPIPDALLHPQRAQPVVTQEPGQRERWVAQTLAAGKPQGERNANATRLVGYFHHKGIPADIIKALMVGFCERCEPPMDELELAGVIDSVQRYQTGELPYGATLPL